MMEKSDCTSFFDSTLDDFQNVTKKPQVFLSNSEENVEQIKVLLKKTYDFAKNEESGAFKDRLESLPELIVQDFDLEQIWQQIELQNEPILNQLLVDVSKFVVGKDSLLFFDSNYDDTFGEDEDVKEEEHHEADDHSESEDESENDRANADIHDEDLSDENFSGDNPEQDSHNTRKSHKKHSVVDDEFFKLEEMENFLNTEEKKLNQNQNVTKTESESDSDEGSIDFFNANDENDDEIVNPKYKEFFGCDDNKNTTVKRNKFFENHLQSDEENLSDENELKVDSEETHKSAFELRQERLRKRIEEIESKAIGEKPWQLKGEITAEDRPQNSLLEEVVEFDISTRPPPVITEETTHRLEDIIRQRIKDKAFDSVERKAKPIETPLEYKKKLILDQEKSKQSLAQIYESEYLKQKESLDPNSSEREPEEPQLHKEIKTLMSSLFTKLDALSNFHFTPKPAMPELKVVSNLPAISMEEVAPIAVSDAALLAPEEVKTKTKGDIIGKSERTDTDKKRERRKKKKKQKIHANAKLTKQNNINNNTKQKQLLNKIIKDKNINKMDESNGLKNITSSKAFFTQLQEQVKSQIQSKADAKRKKTQNTLNAKKIKL